LQYLSEQLFELNAIAGLGISEGRDIAFSPLENTGRATRSNNMKSQLQLRKSWGESTLGLTLGRSDLDAMNVSTDEIGNLFEDDRIDQSLTLAYQLDFESTYQLKMASLGRDRKYKNRFSRFTDGSILVGSDPQSETETEFQLGLGYKSDTVNLEPTLSFGQNKDRVFGALDSVTRKLAVNFAYLFEAFKLKSNVSLSSAEFKNFSADALTNPSSGRKRADTETSARLGLEIPWAGQLVDASISQLSRNSNYESQKLNETTLELNIKGELN
jgi:hypothetical protein